MKERGNKPKEISSDVSNADMAQTVFPHELHLTYQNRKINIVNISDGIMLKIVLFIKTYLAYRVIRIIKTVK